MAHPKGKTSAEVSGVPGWCYRCLKRDGPRCRMYGKSCNKARSDNDCVRRPKIDRTIRCQGNETIRGLHRTDVEEASCNYRFKWRKSEA